MNLTVWLAANTFYYPEGGGYLWIYLTLPRHDVYFTIGEHIGRPGGRTPSSGLDWIHTPPCVALDWWPVHPCHAHAPFTTVSHWSTGGEWVSFRDEVYHNDKRAGFAPFQIGRASCRERV